MTEIELNSAQNGDEAKLECSSEAPKTSKLVIFILEGRSLREAPLTRFGGDHAFLRHDPNVGLGWQLTSVFIFSQDHKNVDKLNRARADKQELRIK